MDTNLLVLLVVGTINPNRIESFKRTSKYDKSDFDLLRHVIAGFDTLYTVAHVMAEVSNLTDLTGIEGVRARHLLKTLLATIQEPAIESSRAASEQSYHRHGLVDAAIALGAREHECTVLTDDFDLYHALVHQEIPAFNFTHLQAQQRGL